MGPITTGADANQYNQIIKSDGYLNYGAEADIVVRVKYQFSFSLCNQGAGTVWYSFNGLTDHGNMLKNDPSQAMEWDNRRISCVFLRSDAPINLRFECWAASL
jgi:hypothetical protein